jgi:hypothetical protein
MIIIVISINFILFLFLFLKGSHSIDTICSSNILEITQHISNTIISYDKELNDHNSLQMKSNHHYNDHHVSFQSDKAKLLSMEESTHGKAFKFESFDSADYDRNHQQQPQQHQHHHSDLITENNYYIRFNHRRQLMNNIQNNVPVDKRKKSKRKV